jgi:O-antigen/teichoic acid export membrane protein
MAEMKRLAKETAIYGLSSILGRFLNWLLVPFYTYTLGSPQEYGVVAKVYAWTALLLVILTYGMETGFFRFANKSEHKPESVYTTSLISLLTTSLLFMVGVTIWVNPMAIGLGVPAHPEFVWMMCLTVAIDAFSAIPFAWLRFTKRPIMFAGLRLLMIGVTIVFTVFFLWVCPMIHKVAPEQIAWFYNPDYRVGYVFVANVISSVVGLLVLLPSTLNLRWTFSWPLLKQLLAYSWPLLVLGIAGIMNQSLDKILIPYLYPNMEVGDEQLGIYAACFKLGLVMMMFTQAFRYAFEPFVFSKYKDTDSKQSYAEGMKYYLLFSWLVFLGVMYYLDILKVLLDPRYHEGLVVVPIVLLCYVFQGVAFNLSFWYKLTDKTKWGAYISFIGLGITVAGNVLFVPIYGYIASAWTSFVCFLVMMVVSWALGQKNYPISYDLKLAGRYVLVVAAFYALGMYVPIDNLLLRMVYRTVLIGIFAAYVLRYDLPAGTVSVLLRRGKGPR